MPMKKMSVSFFFINGFKIGNQTFTSNFRIGLKVYLCIEQPICLKTV